MTRQYLGDLEEHFIIVNWDQPGTGKSYDALPISELTPERYVEDAYALTQYLRERFHQQKIYVFGESWGSILGVWLVQQHPELFHAFVSTGQMVDPVENDIMMYEFAIDLLNEQGRVVDVEGLRRNGPPPYAGHELIGKFGAMNDILNGYMHAHARGEGSCSTRWQRGNMACWIRSTGCAVCSTRSLPSIHRFTTWIFARR